jgi:hypothetical protein
MRVIYECERGECWPSAPKFTDSPGRCRGHYGAWVDLPELVPVPVIPAVLSDELVEKAAREAFWADDMGGHIKGRWTWDTIPEEGRENFRTMVSAVLKAAGFTEEATSE